MESFQQGNRNNKKELNRKFRTENIIPKIKIHWVNATAKYRSWKELVNLKRGQ
jgi:hypothetical protein